MARDATVTDASPLIALAKIGEFGLLQQLFGRVHVPDAVCREIRAKRDACAAELDAAMAAGWMAVVSVESSLPTLGLSTLGQGEAATLAYAIEHEASLVLMDEKAARSHARRHGIAVMGVLGILLSAKRRRFVPAIAPLIEQLQATDFRISHALVRDALTTAGEA